MSTKKRLQVDLTPQASARLDELVESAGLASRAALVRRALRLFDQIHRLSADGSLKLVEPDGTTHNLIIL